MEYSDWTLQAVITLIAGALATVGLAVAMVFAFIKGESEKETVGITVS